jgi:hypothetical protein
MAHGPRFVTVQWQGEVVEVRRIGPLAATKAYLCPGCHQEVAAGVAHVVVVPQLAPDLRRHWHTSCWDRRTTRRPTTR